MGTEKYILNGKIPVVEPDLMTWARWFETADRDVARTKIGNIVISTVFLGLDHSFSQSGPPVVFETMVFGGYLADSEARYSTWEEAEKGHKEMVERVRQIES